MNKAIFALCEGRHNTPAQEAIFPNELNPLDIAGINLVARQKLMGFDAVTVYVTGLSVALVEVIKVCVKYDISLTLMHFDRESGEYYPQIVNEVEICPYCGGAMGNGYACKTCGSH